MFRSAYIRKPFPTRPVLESVLLHVIVLTALLSAPPSPAPRRTASEVEMARAERRIIFYNPIDPLPPISPLEPENSARREAPRERASGRLAFHPVERIVSRPPQPDNSRQTLVQPEAPQLRLPSDVPIPNLVAWMPPVVPPTPSVVETQQELTRIRVPRVPVPVVAAPTPAPPKLTLPPELVPAAPVSELSKVPVPPSPSVAETQQQLAQIRVPRVPVPVVAAPTPAPPKLTLPQVSVPVAPVSELPKAPAPPTPSVAETQQQLAQIRVPRVPVPAVAAPTPLPPAIAPSAESTNIPTLVAVSTAPAPPAPRVPVRIPLGNRAGEFAVSPEGEKKMSPLPGQPGAGPPAREPAPPLPTLGEMADIRVPHLSIAGDPTSAVAGPVAPSQPDPGTIELSAAPPAPPDPPTRDLRALMASTARPSLLPDAPRPRGISPVSEFFGGQRLQTVYLNMPNLTSGTGSWILRFAERNGEGGEDGEISSPVAIKKVDPKYAPSAIRDRVEGTVTLAAQILRDGTVASVEVVRGLDPRLDLSAVQALTLWEFEPARKKGIPIDLEVLVQIPFRLPAF